MLRDNRPLDPGALFPLAAGKSDLGVNRARIERWLKQLEAYAPVAE